MPKPDITPQNFKFDIADELICAAPPIGVMLGLMVLAIIGGEAGWLPRTWWAFLLMVIAGIFLAFALSLTPPVLQARQRLLKANFIEPTEVDLEPDAPSGRKPSTPKRNTRKSRRF